MSRPPEEVPGFVPKFLVDANLPRQVAERLRSAGIQAVDVAERFPPATSDTEIAAFARSGGWSILTRDTDFSDIRHYPPERYAGIVVLIFAPDAPREVILRSVERLLAESQLLARLAGRLVLVQPDRMRVRPTL